MTFTEVKMVSDSSVKGLKMDSRTKVQRYYRINEIEGQEEANGNFKKVHGKWKKYEYLQRLFTYTVHHITYLVIVGLYWQLEAL